tara:strand:+ start:608 stop:1021 length:414 start_codon:yes stop_codon:yes gene_type:complete
MIAPITPEQFPDEEQLKEQRIADGYARLAWSIIEQTIRDIHVLGREKVIVDGKCAYTKDNWPRRKCSYRAYTSFNNHYNHPNEVQILIDWVYSSDLEEWLEMLGVGYIHQHIIDLLEGQIPCIDRDCYYSNWQRRNQ